MAPVADIFGKPGEGVHSYRLCGVAIVDLVLAVLLGVAVARGTGISLPAGIVGVLLLGIIVHHVLGVRTAVDRTLFP